MKSEVKEGGRDFDFNPGIPFHGINKIRISAKFDENCLYTFTDPWCIQECRKDWNKGPGFRELWRARHKNTLMLGWRGDSGRGVIELSPYWHADDKTPYYIGKEKPTTNGQVHPWTNRITDPGLVGAMAVAPGEWFWYEIELTDPLPTTGMREYRMTFSNGASFDGMPVPVTDDSHWITGWWFGGNCDAPHDMSLEWIIEPCAPPTTPQGGGYGSENPPYML